MDLDQEQRSVRARIAANIRWAHSDGIAGTQAAREAFLASFERRVDPDAELATAERARRADRLRKAHFAQMARRSAQVRAERAADPR